MAIEVTRLYAEIKTNAKEATADLHAFGNEAQKTSGKISLLDKVLGMFGKTSKLVDSSVQTTNLALAKGDIELNKFTETLLTNANAWKNNKKAMDDAAKGYQKVFAETSKLQKTLSGIAGGNARGAAQANRFVSSNILAQVQDVFVTAAMGMNPMTIALQQGSQFQYILTNVDKPLQAFIAGLQKAFSVSGLLAIGLTGLVAALIQMVDWAKVGEVVVKGLVSVFNALGMNKIANWFKDLIDYSNKAWDSIKRLLKVSEDFNSEMKDLADKKFVLETELLNPEGLSKGDLQEYIYSWNKYGEILNKLETEKKAYIDKISSEKLSQKKYDQLYNAYMKEYEEARSEAWSQAQDYAKAKMELDELQKALDDRNDKEAESLRLIEQQIQAWNKLNVSANQKINDLITQKSLIGAGTYETVYTQTLTDLTRQAEGEGLALTPERTQQLKQYAEDTARLSDEVEKLNDKYNLAKSSVKSFFSEMRQGLKEGESAWEAFGNAVLNVLDKIIDKAMDFGVDMLFMAGRSYFGDISSGSTWNPATSAPAVKPKMVANGGVFSNGIYSSPTVFQFAKGGKFGVMGEAGPEAVMPLTRGPDGSLGVKAANTNSSPVIVNVINNSTAQAHVEQRQTSQGIELDVVIDQLVAEKMNKPGTSSNSALRAFSNQKLIAR